MKNTYSLFDLHSYVKQVFALNFSDSLWIQAEISQSKEVRGQVYMDLIEKSDKSDDIIAQVNAIIQFKSLLSLKRKLGTLLNSILVEGTAIRVKVKLEFHERYGYKLMIEDIDPSYTLGQAELKRQQIIERLSSEDLLDLNETIPLPSIIQRLAVISSETAAGYKDFIEHLKTNSYGYQFKIDLFKTSMQGKNTSPELVHAMERINSNSSKYDVVIIIRGGGAKLDLASFDDYNIGHVIANHQLPVICGIGHEIDNTIADIVANTSLKTPTAVADFLITRCLHFESDLMELARLQQQFIKEKIYDHTTNLNNLEQSLGFISLQKIASRQNTLEQLSKDINHNIVQKLKLHQINLDHLSQIVKISNPKQILKKGYSMSKINGKIVVSSKNIKAKDKIELIFHDGVKNVVAQK